MIRCKYARDCCECNRPVCPYDDAPEGVTDGDEYDPDGDRFDYDYLYDDLDP